MDSREEASLVVVQLIDERDETSSLPTEKRGQEGGGIGGGRREGHGIWGERRGGEGKRGEWSGGEGREGEEREGERNGEEGWERRRGKGREGEVCEEGWEGRGERCISPEGLSWWVAECAPDLAGAARAAGCL